jgi:uncharacterized membrane protein YdbT with pleckstrin-like domain
MTIQTPITLIKGNGIYPTPKSRRILPTKALLWKYYLKDFILGFIAMGVLYLMIVFFSFVSSFDDEFVIFKDPEFQLFMFTLVFVCLLIILPVIMLCQLLYIRNMEFIVHGDEIIVKKGLFNKTVKYCPFRTVTNISTNVGVFDRLFKIGCIEIETAGTGGMTNAPEEKLEGLKVFGEIREYIVLQLRNFTHPPDKLVKQEYEGGKESFQNNILFELQEIKKEFSKKKEVK